MKAILVIDMPEYVDFNKVKTVDVGLCFNAKEYTEPFIKSNVPLKPLPKPMPYEQTDTQTVKAVKIDNGFRLGWNACLKEITDD